MRDDIHITPSARSIAEVAVQSLGERLVNVEYMGSGSTSKVFRVQSEGSVYVLKIANPHSGKTVSYGSDFAIRSALTKSGLPVAKPITVNCRVPSETSVQWALDKYCQGSHPQRGSIPSAVSTQVGQLLRGLHALAASGFGSLENSLGNTDHYCSGQFSNPIDGLLSRFESPWPFSKKPLELHPAVCSEPSLAGSLYAMEEKLASFPHNGMNVVVHTDLHEAQMLVKDNSLVALLDFNEAMIGRPEWDLGSYYYFHGLGCLHDLLKGYTEDVSARTRLANEALYAAILIALHHGNRGEVLEKPHRIDAAVLFLTNNLP